MGIALKKFTHFFSPTMSTTGKNSDLYQSTHNPKKHDISRSNTNESVDHINMEKAAQSTEQPEKKLQKSRQAAIPIDNRAPNNDKFYITDIINATRDKLKPRLPLSPVSSSLSSASNSNSGTSKDTLKNEQQNDKNENMQDRKVSSSAKINDMMNDSNTLTTIGSKLNKIVQYGKDYSLTKWLELEYLEIQGSGTFGLVFKSKINETNEIVAIKKVLQNNKVKNRELSILKNLNHPNVINLKCYFIEKSKPTITKKNEPIYLNLIFEFLPQSLYQRIQHFKTTATNIPPLEIKCYMFQLFKGLNYLHNCNKICHRDVKPQNILINPDTFQLKICDFGSAKIINPLQPNVSYICSRYYRAPELILGSINYNHKIDLWSAGCIMAELFLLKPFFKGISDIDQFVEIIRVKGTPNQFEIEQMNGNYKDYTFPRIHGVSLGRIFKNVTNDMHAIELMECLLKYNPNERLDSLNCLCLPFFNELRTNIGIPNKTIQKLNLFEFDKTLEFNHLSPKESIEIELKLFKKS
ncbi:serine/threonine protein kinase RIM11 NDAI_0H02930 [Naumovozyma dairenensis CBS 421]|uniref:Protein kinase domain-containing protein n=1 Tax=Naumovozyma dairenensis (strain ATCC 10597 / BCRC 20456 / CBS 421 / NBRC 0211 / NRRL Y-12639) TaxID=1071378 RepID=G0WFA5_NAUDC|nr:hypothetical protein NDAI_0H02930 [Naumovozyma dairenensis CBS 421]CCD26466.1 hypothetical protein NDAI_0H02930 [Naumovozyma dairenensis CBS 421]